MGTRNGYPTRPVLGHAEEKLAQEAEDRKLGQPNRVSTCIAVSNFMKEIMEVALRISPLNVTVLILGESGVGKEVLAHYIHDNSQRRNGPFITINCGAIPEHLLETELFGYNRGAFTGALHNGKPGMFEEAHGGTLLLDEIGELPLHLQVKILRALETNQITRVGACGPTSIDVRIIAATNRHLDEMVAREQFREDLFYRLNVVPITIPPLRKRREDIVPLAEHFLSCFNTKHGKELCLNQGIMSELEQYSWPGNVRELRNIIERLVALYTNENLCLDCLPHNEERHEEADKLRYIGTMNIHDATMQIEKQILKEAAQQYKSTREIAKAVGIDQSTVVKKLKKYDLAPICSPAGKQQS